MSEPALEADSSAGNTEEDWRIYEVLCKEGPTVSFFLNSFSFRHKDKDILSIVYTKTDKYRYV